MFLLYIQKYQDDGTIPHWANSNTGTLKNEIKGSSFFLSQAFWLTEEKNKFLFMKVVF